MVLSRLVLMPLMIGGFDARGVLGIGGKWDGEWLWQAAARAVVTGSGRGY